MIGIQRISLASNNIRTLPDEIGNCCELQELYLSNNSKLSSIPSSAGHLRCVSVCLCVCAHPLFFSLYFH